MRNPVRTAFARRILSIPVKSLQFLREFDPRGRHHAKYKQIKASIEAVGIIEPVVVSPSGSGAGAYLVLDGCKRVDIVRDGKLAASIDCIVATDDEAYTYNRRVNYLSPVGEHQMIVRALVHNSEERIAEALNVDVRTIQRKLGLLTGVCPEAVEILKNRRATAKAFAVLKKMKPVRQVEAAHLMVASNMYTGRFANALLAGTREDMLVRPPTAQAAEPDSRAEAHQLHQETDNLLRDLKRVEESYGAEVLALSVTEKYLRQVLGNAAIHRLLEERHPAILESLESLLSQIESEASVQLRPKPIARTRVRNKMQIRAGA